MATQRCAHCSAPLPLGTPGSVVVCSFCRSENRVQGPVAHAAPAASSTTRPSSAAPIVAVVVAAVVLVAGGVGVAASVLSVSNEVGPNVTVTTRSSVTTSTSTGSSASTGRASEPTRLRIADLGSFTGEHGWTAIETTGMQGEVRSFDPIANVAWAEDVARHWSPDAALYALYVHGVREDGTIDATSTTDEHEADYRFYSPTRRRAAREMQAVSTTIPPTEIRIRVTEGEAKILLGADIDEDEPVAPGGLTCPLRTVIAQARAKGLPQRPGYALMARVHGGAFDWMVNMPGINSGIGRLPAACAAE